eukprot:g26973.t1
MEAADKVFNIQTRKEFIDASDVGGGWGDVGVGVVGGGSDFVILDVGGGSGVGSGVPDDSGAFGVRDGNGGFRSVTGGSGGMAHSSRRHMNGIGKSEEIGGVGRRGSGGHVVNGIAHIEGEVLGRVEDLGAASGLCLV